MICQTGNGRSIDNAWRLDVSSGHCLKNKIITTSFRIAVWVAGTHPVVIGLTWLQVSQCYAMFHGGLSRGHLTRVIFSDAILESRICYLVSKPLYCDLVVKPGDNGRSGYDHWRFVVRFCECPDGNSLPLRHIPDHISNI